LAGVIKLADIWTTIAADTANRQLMTATGKPSVAFFHHFHLSITDDTADTKAAMQAQYGPGHVYQFALDNYRHGYDLATAFYTDLIGTPPDMSRHKQQSFPEESKLFLAVHVMAVMGV
jgi:hypothetical protein